MKKLIFAVITLLLIVVLAVWGDRILSRALDAELGALLSKELGLPVKLAPIKATILTLKASSAKLVMGDPNDPAVVATEVIVTLAWSDLLKREIRLVRASAKDLMVAPSLWPSSNDPWPEDYRFLEPYLPKKLQFDSGRYIDEEGSSYSVKQFSWQRKFQGGATADWSEDRAEQTLTIGAAVTSLDALLRLAPIELDVTIGVTDQPLSNIQLKAHLQPADTSGYILDSTIQAAGMNAQLTARNTQNWRLPNRSEVTIDTLEHDKLMNFFQSYTDSASASEPEAILASALPQLSLPQHQGHVSIDKIQWGNEVGKDSAFDFTTSEQGIKISSLTSKGPSATLQGQIDLATAQDGWALKVTADLQARDPNDSIAGHYINANWFWRAGHTQLDGKGDTWGGLLNAMKGEVDLSGAHRGKVETPVKMAAQLGRLPGEFTLEELKIELGEGHITGSASLSGTTQRELKVDLKADQLNLDFLYADESGEALPGMAVPEYLDFLPGVEISWKILVTGLQAPGISLSEADITLQREPGQGYLTVIAQGVSGGDLHLQLDAHALDDGETDVSLAAKLSKLDIPQLFQQELLVKSRASGTINFAGSGPSIQKIFQALSGKAELTVDLRRDNNWQR
ncbi:MAG: hypothetical protein V7700_04970, partial [Halioglobus sp.]